VRSWLTVGAYIQDYAMKLQCGIAKLFCWVVLAVVCSGYHVWPRPFVAQWKSLSLSETKQDQGPPHLENDKIVLPKTKRQQAYFDPETDKITIEEVLVGAEDEELDEEDLDFDEEIPLEELQYFLRGEQLPPGYKRKPRTKAKPLSALIEDGTNYITVERLRNWWQDNCVSFGRLVEEFTVPEALKLLESDSFASSSSSLPAGHSPDNLTEITEEVPLHPLSSTLVQ